MALKVKKEAPAPVQPKPTKALKAKKAVLNGIHSYKKKILTSPTF